MGTSLLAIGLFMAGIVAYNFMPVAAIPRVDFPMISVGASLPGADPATVASSLAAPLERRLAQIAGVTEITSASTLGGCSITIQFDLNRNVDGAARDVQAAINASAGDLPINLPNPPTYRKINPADAPIMILAMQSDILPPVQVFEYGDSIIGQRLSQVEGVSQVFISGADKSAVRVQINPGALASTGMSLEDVRSYLEKVNVDSPKGSFDGDQLSYTLVSNDQLLEGKGYQDLILTQRSNAPIRLSALGRAIDATEARIVDGAVADLGQLDRRGNPPLELRQHAANPVHGLNHVGIRLLEEDDQHGAVGAGPAGDAYIFGAVEGPAKRAESNGRVAPLRQDQVLVALALEQLVIADQRVGKLVAVKASLWASPHSLFRGKHARLPGSCPSRPAPRD